MFCVLFLPSPPTRVSDVSGLKIDWIKAAREDHSVKVTVEYGTEGESHNS